MNKFAKWMSFLMCLFAGATAFVTAFVPHYEAHKLKFPPEPEFDEDDTVNTMQGVQQQPIDPLTPAITAQAPAVQSFQASGVSPDFTGNGQL